MRKKKRETILWENLYQYWKQRADIVNAFARKRGVYLGRVTAEELFILWWESDAKCYWCKEPIELGSARKGFHHRVATLDHVKRIFEGGRNVIGNLVFACKQCNETRHHV